jgi:hypothetical protein
MVRREEAVQDLSITDLSLVPPSHGSPSYHDDGHMSPEDGSCFVRVPVAAGDRGADAIVGWVKQTSSPNRKVHLGDKGGRYRGTPPCQWPSRVTSPSEWTPERSPFSRTGYWSWDEELARLAITGLNHRAQP